MDQIYKTDLNELFSYQRKGEKLEEKEKVIEIEIERLRDFKEHPFHVKDDKEMSLLKESIKNYGILSPLIVRPVLDGVYEIVKDYIEMIQITALRKQLETEKVSQNFMISIFNNAITPKKTNRKITLTEKKLTRYFPPEYSQEEMEKVIETLLEEWTKRQEG